MSIVYNCIICICIVLLFKTVIVWLKISFLAKISCVGDVASSFIILENFAFNKICKKLNPDYKIINLNMSIFLLKNSTTLILLWNWFNKSLL